MEMMEAIRQRHSVRQYTDEPIPAEKKAALQAEVDACNEAGGLHIQLVTDEPRAFDSLMAHYGKFTGVRNYIALVGEKTEDLEEKCGYYGERIALKAQMLGLNTCWVALTFSRGAARQHIQIDSGEALCVVIALGYGETQGEPHKSKDIGAVSRASDDAPDWFRAGAEAALLAPTAMNQQKFLLEWKDGKVRVSAGKGFYVKVDLGIVMYHFEQGAGGNVIWK